MPASSATIAARRLPPLPEPNACCATAMRKASRRIAQMYDDALAPSGLKSTQYSILAALVRRAEVPPTMQELAKALVMDRSTLGHNLRPLERDGLVELRHDASDGRSRRIALTAAGRARVKAAKAGWQKAQDRFHAVFGQSEAARLRATLLTIAHDDRLAVAR